MAKVTITEEFDSRDRKYYKLEKKKGTISRREAYEAMESAGHFGRFLIDFPVPEDVPFELYDPGDCWWLYAPEDLLGDRAEDEFNKGYEACLRDYGLDKADPGYILTNGMETPDKGGNEE